MAGKFLTRVILTLLIFILLAGVITAEDNTRRSLTGRETRKVYLSDIEDYIREKING